MAKAVPGAGQVYPILALLDGDVERMNKASMRLYLRRRLGYIEARIRALSNAQETQGIFPTYAWDINQLDPDMWESALQLSYLESMREAVVETLAALRY
jgi:hypothetical protein